jgi:hypothetical protein
VAFDEGNHVFFETTEIVGDRRHKGALDMSIVCLNAGEWEALGFRL